MYKERLFGRELLVINTLCAAGHPMTVQDMVDAHHRVSQSTIQSVVRKLLEKGLLQVTGVTHCSNVLARTFDVTEEARKEVIQYILEEYQQIRSVISVSEAIMAMIKSEENPKKRKQLLQEVSKIIDRMQQ